MLHPFAYNTCGFIGYNEILLFQHLEHNESCKNFHEQKGVASGLLSTLSPENITQNQSYPHINSFVFKRYYTDGILDNVQLNLKDDTIEKRVNVRTFKDSIQRKGNIHSYMTNSRAIAVVQKE